MKYFIDIDNTICHTEHGEYKNATPIPERIKIVNDLKNAGHHITLWTARGAISKIDYRELTESQLKSWGVLYDILNTNEKPAFDILIDDKAYNVNDIWPIDQKKEESFSDKSENTSETGIDVFSPPEDKKRVIPYSKNVVKVINKTWGEEIIIVNNELYCGKILHFTTKGAWGSMHFHMNKTETWFVHSGKIRVYWPEPKTGEIFYEVMTVGDTITHNPGDCHQVECLEETYIFEISTTHWDHDTYRIGGNQKFTTNLSFL